VLQNLPLTRIRVLDFGHIVAGPFCARMLADLGADVVKVETATRRGRTGARRGGGGSRTASGRTPLLAHINRNRRSIDLNLKTEEGSAFAHQLIDTADVLVENFSSGVMDRLGIGYDDVSKTNPRLVYASMSAFGHTGPRKDWTGMNVTLQAFSGMMLATGESDDPPIGISNSWNDYIGGLHTAVAIIGALAKRRVTGLGYHLDVSQFECSVAMIGSLLLSSTVTGAAPARIGSRSASAAPQGCYRCAGTDQWCTISVKTDAQWHALLHGLGERAGPLRDPHYATLAGRLQHHDAIDAVLEAWTSERTPDDVEARVQACGVWAAAMRRGNTIAQTAEWQRILKPLGDGEQSVGLPFSFRGTASAPLTPAPRVGADSGDVLCDWLGR
jgi:crotonobetainyl-CoA:carnitine CoA-transferase CaiB-like acyl-CoA transferase